jgi:hypothetical protein
MTSRAHPHLEGEALADAITAAARCKAMHYHRLEVIPGDPDRRPAFGTLITYRCENCGTIRYDTVSRITGELVTRSYDTPDWYRAANEEVMPISWWRATWFETLDRAYLIDAEQTKAKRGKRGAS